MTKTTTTSTNSASANSAKSMKSKPCQRFLPTTVGKWLSSKTAIELASCQRGEVFDAAFVRGLKRSVLRHWPISAVCVTENKDESGGAFYVLFDGQQRTAAMREARKSCNAAELELFDAAPLFLEVVSLPEDLPEGEFFRYRNTNNAPTKAQAALGNYSQAVREVISAVTQPSLVQALYSRRTKADSFEISRVGKLDDLLQALALALLSPESTSTNFGKVSSTLESLSKAEIEPETLAKALERAPLKCEAVAGALKALSSVEDLKKLYRAVCAPKVLVPLFAGTGTDTGAVLAAIRALFGDDGKAKQCAPITDFSVGEGSPTVAIDWYTLMVTDRGNDAGVNRKRAAFFAREYTRARAAQRMEAARKREIENEFQQLAEDETEDLPAGM